MEVPYPPPPARPEWVPPRPDDAPPDTVWIDGEWEWRGRGYTWVRGRWVALPAGAGYALPVAVRNQDGVLYYAPGAFRGSKGEEIADPSPLATARESLPVPGESAAPSGRERDRGRGRTGPTEAVDEHLDGGSPP